MTTGIEPIPNLAQHLDWIRKHDSHPEARIRLLEHVNQVLQSGADAAERLRLAEQLERWRYQLLDWRGQSPGWHGTELASVIDMLVARLTGRHRRDCRRTFQAVCDSAFDPPEAEHALAVLERNYPIEKAESLACRLTRENFSIELKERDRTLTRRYIVLYAPLYLSSYCINYCLYCGFRYPESIRRKHLDVNTAVKEARALVSRGFRHILLVAGDYPSLTTIDYYTEVIKQLKPLGVECGIEIAPQSTVGYRKLAHAGVRSVTLYQETYQLDLYRQYHPRGTKANYFWRLEAMDRAAEAGFKRLGLGILLGLGDPQQEILAMMRHARYLQTRFPDCTIAFSLPRIHDAPKNFRVPFPVDDDLFVRMYCALRIAFPKAVLVLSTRESPQLRNRLANICITQMSAGSSTVPGGYEDKSACEELGKQFAICDHRSPAEVAAWLKHHGIQPQWELDFVTCSNSDSSM